MSFFNFSVFLLGMTLSRPCTAGELDFGKGNCYAEPTPQMAMRGPSFFRRAGKIVYEKYWLYWRF